MKKLLLLVLLPFFLLSCPQPTEDSLPVVIDGLTSSGGDTSITLSWTTDVAAECTLSYGPYAFYGLSASATADPEKLNHTVTLTGLRPHTNYHFKISANPESTEYGVTATEDHEEHTTLDSPNALVVSGDEWSAVGALCFADADGFYGPFCTGVLIADDVVLTAAHCLSVDEDYYGAVPSTSNVVFYVEGNDANPTNGGGEPETGTVYGVAAIEVNQDYSGGTHDLALVHLTERVTGIDPIGYNTDALTASYGGDSFTISGFDASYSGLKREKGREISFIDSSFFTDVVDTKNLGSAGIPAFMEIGGGQKVIGISTSVAEEPFTDPATYTRVDSDSSWISGKISDFSSP